MVLARRRPAVLILAVLLVLAALAAGLGAALSHADPAAVTWTGQHATQDEAVTWSAPVRHAPGT